MGALHERRHLLVLSCPVVIMDGKLQPVGSEEDVITKDHSLNNGSQGHITSKLPKAAGVRAEGEGSSEWEVKGKTTNTSCSPTTNAVMVGCFSS